MLNKLFFLIEYPNLSSLSDDSGIEGLLTLPNASFIWFWTTILIGIFLILVMSLYFGEKLLKGRGNLLSAMGVASLACILLATLGSLIGMFTVTTLVPILVFGALIIAVWLMSGNRNV